MNCLQSSWFIKLTPENCDASAIADVKSIRIMAQAVGVARRIVNGDMIKGESIGGVHGEGCTGVFLHVEISDGRISVS